MDLIATGTLKYDLGNVFAQVKAKLVDVVS